LGWKNKISFDQLVEDMMSADRLISKKTKSYAA